MPAPLDITFDVLVSTSNINAVDILIPALDLTKPEIVDRAVSSLIKRRSTRGLVEVIRRLECLSDKSRSEIQNQSTRMTIALKQCLLHGEDELRSNGLAFVHETENFEQIDTLIEMLGGDHDEISDRAMQILIELVNNLYEHCNFGKGTKSGGKYLRNSRQIRQNVLTSLDRACGQFDSLSHPEELIECILLLGDPENFAVRKVLSHSNSECKDMVAKTLMESTHPGVMQLILEFLSKNYPHAKAFEAISQRSDSEFICHVLRWLPNQLSETQQKNFQQIESVVWLNPYGPSLELVPPGLQKSLVQFVSSLGIPSNQKTLIQEWIVRHGSLEGRLAATEVLTFLDQGAVESILYNSLDAEDEEVQAWATGQLRSQGIPEAVTLLIERLDSPKETVREAARGELESFNIEFMLELFDELRPDICRMAGKLVEKIEPDCITKLATEMENPIRRKRIRAARAALAMGLHFKVLPGLLAMLDDEDQLVRRTGVEVLGYVGTLEVVARLKLMLDDPSPRVRETVVKALESSGKAEDENTLVELSAEQAE